MRQKCYKIFIAINFCSLTGIYIPVILPEKPIAIKSPTVKLHKETTRLPIPLTTTKKVARRFKKQCRAMTNIVFLKTHKTASSTIQVRMIKWWKNLRVCFYAFDYSNASILRLQTHFDFANIKDFPPQVFFASLLAKLPRSENSKVSFWTSSQCGTYFCGGMRALRGCAPFNPICTGGAKMPPS